MVGLRIEPLVDAILMEVVITRQLTKLVRLHEVLEAEAALVHPEGEGWGQG